MKVVEGVIYKAKRGHVFQTDTKQDREYNCYSPCMTGDFGIVDCWPCTEDGDVHPGYNISGVPVDVDALGTVVGKME
ncbi:MAG: hypothetical protein GY801_25535 [bacterium]|nr:hypothetical protein [bacterium]